MSRIPVHVDIGKEISVFSTMNTPALIAQSRRGIPAAGRPWASRPVLGKFTRAAMSTMAVLVAFLAGGSSAAWAATARFVPDAADASWDGAVATVAFKETNVAVAGGVTTISAKVTVDVDVVCTRGESTLDIHRSAAATDVHDYPIEDGAVAGTATVPLQVAGLKVSGYSCAIKHRSITAVLEDFWTGATLVHKT